ncbi:MAG: hypothetical protein ACRDZX_14880 [Acidimicrobiales bacterium]
MGWLIALGVVALLVSAPWWVADSRDGRDWKPAALAGPKRTGRSVRPVARSPTGALVRRLWAKGSHHRPAVPG